jgi:hypothetical protein
MCQVVGSLQCKVAGTPDASNSILHLCCGCPVLLLLPCCCFAAAAAALHLSCSGCLPFKVRLHVFHAYSLSEHATRQAVLSGECAHLPLAPFCRGCCCCPAYRWIAVAPHLILLAEDMQARCPPACACRLRQGRRPGAVQHLPQAELDLAHHQPMSAVLCRAVPQGLLEPLPQHCPTSAPGEAQSCASAARGRPSQCRRCHCRRKARVLGGSAGACCAFLWGPLAGVCRAAPVALCCVLCWKP